MLKKGHATLRFSPSDLLKHVDPTDSVITKFMQQKKEETDLHVVAIRDVSNGFKELLKLVVEAFDHDMQEIAGRCEALESQNNELRAEVTKLQEQLKGIKNTRTYLQVEPLAPTPADQLPHNCTTSDGTIKTVPEVKQKKWRVVKSSAFSGEQMKRIYEHFDNAVPGMITKGGIIRQIVADPVMTGVDKLEKRVRQYINNHRLWEQYGFDYSHHEHGGRRPGVKLAKVALTPGKIELQGQTVKQDEQVAVGAEDLSVRSKKERIRWGDTVEEIKQNIFIRLKELEDDRVPITFSNVKKRYPSIINDHIARRKIFSSIVDMIREYNMWKLQS